MNNQAPTIQSEPHPDGAFFIAQSNKSRIYHLPFSNTKTLEVYLNSNSLIANHIVPAFKEKPGIQLLQGLFSKEEDKNWGHEREKEIAENERQNNAYSISIANFENPVRWTSGRGLVVVGNDKNSYAIMNIRSLTAPTDKGKLADIGGYGEKDDLFNPGYGAHREIAEELAIITTNKELLIPTFDVGRGVNFEKILTTACKDTGLIFNSLKNIKATERKDLAQGHRIKIFLDNSEKLDENLIFLYEPLSNCGIDVITPVEYKIEMDILKDLNIGFAEYFGKPGNYTVLGKGNDIAIINLEQLLNEFDRKKPSNIEAHLRNAYTGKYETVRIPLSDEEGKSKLNGSSTLQLQIMKLNNYKFDIPIKKKEHNSNLENSISLSNTLKKESQSKINTQNISYEYKSLIPHIYDSKKVGKLEGVGGKEFLEKLSSAYDNFDAFMDEKIHKQIDGSYVIGASGRKEKIKWDDETKKFCTKKGTEFNEYTYLLARANAMNKVVKELCKEYTKK